MMNDYRYELDAKIKDKIQKHECICEPELLDRVQEIYQELRMSLDDLNDKCKELEKTNEEHAVRYSCKHFKGQHPTDYSDCTVICDLYNDDYVSRSACESCEDFELN